MWPRCENLPYINRQTLSEGQKVKPPTPLPYTEAPQKNGYNTNLPFDVTCTNKINEKKKTKRESGKLPGSTPFQHLCGHVAKTFLTLIGKHFPKDKGLSKIFNRNTIKVSNSCLPNVKQTISNKNNRLLQLHRMKESSQDSKLYNSWPKKKKLLPSSRHIKQK